MEISAALWALRLGKDFMFTCQWLIGEINKKFEQSSRDARKPIAFPVQ